MAGSGIRPDNAQQIADTGVDALHFSARKPHDSGMRFRRAGTPMGGCPAVDEYALYEADPAVIRAITSQFNP